MSSVTSLDSRAASCRMRARNRTSLLAVVLGRFHRRLRKQGQSADRRLDLMPDIRDEIAAHRVDPPALGDVFDQQGHQPVGKADRPHPHFQRLRAPAEGRQASCLPEASR